MTYKQTAIFYFYAKRINEFLKKNVNKKYSPKVIKILLVVASYTPTRTLFEFFIKVKL